MSNAILTNGTARLEVSDFEDCETLADLIELYREQLNIPAGATVAVDGEAVNAEDFDLDDLADDAEISATKTSGSKG